MKAIILKFTGPVHFGTERSDYGSSYHTLHSDTIYSAICQVWALTGHTNWIKDMANLAEIVLSSTFPFFDNGQNTNYFFPKPYATLFKFQAQLPDDIDRKAPKKVQWIDKDTFENWRRNGSLTMEADNFKGSYYSGAELPEYMYKSEVYPRVQVSRVDGEDAKPYYIEKLYFHKNAGLYFLYQGNDDNLERLIHALDILRDEGLGTDRKVGHGQFVYEIEDIAFNTLNGNKDKSVSLSLFCPKDKDWIKKHLASRESTFGYSLIKRGGWITTPPYHTYRKNPVNMFGEGSVFNFSGDSAGIVQDVLPDSIKGENRPDHPIYRFGRAIFLPVNS